MENKFNHFYFHSVRNELKILESILQSKAILSREKCSNFKHRGMGFNGNKWISLCKYGEMQSLYDSYFRYAFDLLVRNKIGIVLDDKIKAYKTSYMSYDEFYYEMTDDDSNIRYSDCLDEYQVKDSIDISHFIAITFPYEYILKNNSNILNCDKSSLQNLLSKYNLNVPLIDSSDGIFEDELDKLEKKLIKRI